MNPFYQRLFIASADELVRPKGRDITHVLAVSNPGAAPPKLPWFIGEYLQLWFGDVVSEADAQRCQTKAPTTDDLHRALDFSRSAWQSNEAKVLVTCDYGASRSPALAYVLVADQLGFGREPDALDLILQIRLDAVPNRLVVELGDTVLMRKGALLGPLKGLYSTIDEEISKWHAR
ncbi:hypothetical protein SDC9_147054 [bioreactor metagenome]|uniref:Tyrosine specific protein phosphatases domain-containing protein n=1 Tax=bioreactor metagenome TaxID=1076179 RepID=A0A645EEV0_9ZZZZ